MDESGPPETTAVKRTVRPQPAGNGGLPAKGKLGAVVDGILNYCRTRVRVGVVEVVNGNIKTVLRRSRGYKNLGYLLLKAQRMAVTKIEFIVLQKAA